MEPAAEQEDSSHERLIFDSVAALVLLSTALLGAYLPRYLARNGAVQAGSASSLAFHLGNMLSGGVMLSAGFCHLLADSLRQLAFIGRFPIATFLAAVGYLITLLADQIVTVITAEPGSGAGGHSYSRLEDQQQLCSDAIEMAVQPLAAGPDAGRAGRFGKAAGSPGSLTLLSLGLPEEQQQQQAKHGSLLSGRATPGAAAAPVVSALAGDEATCLFASGSPRAISAARLHARSSTPKAWDNQQQQQQQQQHVGGGSSSGVRGTVPAVSNGHHHHLERDGAVGGGGDCCSSLQSLGRASGGSNPQQQQQQAVLPCSQLLAGVASPTAGQQQQQQQQQLHRQHSLQSGRSLEVRTGSGSRQQQQHLWGGSDDGDWAAGASLEPCGASAHQQLLRGGSGVGGCGCCCHGGGGGSGRPEVMTEARSVARAAEHLELDMAGGGEADCGPGAAGHNHAHFQVFLSHRPLTFYTTLLLACALCIHSILEGIALGAQESMQATRDIMLAIAAHKGLAAYALGASIVESNASSCKFWSVVAMFAAATPLGIAIGYATSTIGHGSASAAMSALASGTFLYVALNEVIPKELEHPDGHRLLKVAALLLGFGLMSLLAVWA